MKKEKSDDYLESFKEYQDKMYLPGYYLGGKIHPYLKAKTKAGGYFLLITGIFLLPFYTFKLFSNFTLENVFWIIPIVFTVLLIVLGVKFVKLNSHK